MGISWMNGIKEFHRKMTGKGYKYLRPGLETTFYDATCVQVIDPFGRHAHVGPYQALPQK